MRRLALCLMLCGCTGNASPRLTALEIKFNQVEDVVAKHADQIKVIADASTPYIPAPIGQAVALGALALATWAHKRTQKNAKQIATILPLPPQVPPVPQVKA